MGQLAEEGGALEGELAGLLGRRGIGGPFEEGGRLVAVAQAVEGAEETEAERGSEADERRRSLAGSSLNSGDREAIREGDDLEAIGERAFEGDAGALRIGCAGSRLRCAG